MKKLQYSYTVLRYVHDSMTAEFVNVGIVLHVPALNFVKAKVRKSIGRIRNAFPDLDRVAFVATMNAVERSLEKVARSSEKEGLFPSGRDAGAFARKALPQDDSSLQWSPIGSGVTDNAEKTFDRLFERFVARYDANLPSRKSDDDVWRPVQQLLASKKIEVPLTEKTIVGATDRIEFEHAWKNGKWHVYEPLSLDLADSEGIKDKARRWRGHLEAVADGAQEDIQLNFILGAPSSKELHPAYSNAVAILKKAPFSPAI